MKYRKWKKQIICVSLSIFAAAVITGFLMEVKASDVQKKLAEEVFRFHVIANSNSERDQSLKMKVKENIIRYMEKQIPESESVEETRIWAASHLSEIENVARETLKKEECSDYVVAEVGNCYFPDKTYGDITFPKGTYDALRIKIGNGEGQNWWCVLYPNLCFIDAVHAVVPEEGKEELKEVLDQEEYEMVTAFSKFKIKWFFF